MRTFNKTEQAILDCITNADENAKLKPYFETFMMPWDHCAFAFYRVRHARDRNAALKLAEEGYLLQPLENLFIKNFKAPK